MAAPPSTDSRFRGLYDRHFLDVRNYCLRRLPASDVNDAVAEVFLVVWKRIDGVPAGDEARPWVFGIARNVVRNTRRSAHRRSRLQLRVGSTGGNPDPTPDVLVVRRSEDAEVLAALSQMRESDREILELSFWDDLTHKEIAQVLGIGAHAVTMRLSRARNRLASQLGMDPNEHVSAIDPRPAVEGGER